VVLRWAHTEGKPRAHEWWQHKVAPAPQARRESRAARKQERRAQRKSKDEEPAQVPSPVESVVVDGEVVEPFSDLAIAQREYQRNMSSSEAQARYLLALLAKRLSDEQLTMLANANI